MATFLGAIGGYSTKDDYRTYKVIRKSRNTGKEVTYANNLTLDEALFIAERQPDTKSTFVMVREERKRK
jgi:hypothetical protein